MSRGRLRLGRHGDRTRRVAGRQTGRLLPGDMGREADNRRTDLWVVATDGNGKPSNLPRTAPTTGIRNGPPTAARSTCWPTASARRRPAARRTSGKSMSRTANSSRSLHAPKRSPASTTPEGRRRLLLGRCRDHRRGRIPEDAGEVRLTRIWPRQAEVSVVHRVRGEGKTES